MMAEAVFGEPIIARGFLSTQRTNPFIPGPLDDLQCDGGLPDVAPGHRAEPFLCMRL